MTKGRTALIVGAGPAGLTAALELLRNTDIQPIVYEMDNQVGGISKTITFKGNRLDLGGHRFFSKSDRVMDWWQGILPIQGKPSKDDLRLNRKVPVSSAPGAPDPNTEDRVLLIRNRLSRILFLRRFFDYPISLNRSTMLNLGPERLVKIALSYARARLFPTRPEKSLEDFFTNRFGKELYLTFFKDYTEKVWGIPCDRISSEWGAQRVKGLSIFKAVLHAVKQIAARDASISQKTTETSLIEQFLYPKLGPGQLWETVADLVVQGGGEIFLGHRVVGFEVVSDRIAAVKIRNDAGRESSFRPDYVISTMPVQDLIAAMGDAAPEQVREVAGALNYRDFIAVGVLLKKLEIRNETDTPTINDIVPDNWIYVQEKDVLLGRIQVFNNWSPYMVKDENTVWLGLEYFCQEGDALWSKSDAEMIDFAIEEMVRIGIASRSDVLDGTVVRQAKTYPGYFGAYERFGEIREFTDRLSNLFLIGRNGMHKYNNQDHSMLTAMTAVENIRNGTTDKSNLWSVNTEQDYHEEK